MTVASESCLAGRLDDVSAYDLLPAAHTSEVFGSRAIRRPERRRGWTSLQLEPGAFVVASTIKRFDGLRLQETAVNRRSLHRIRAPAHSASLLISSRRSAAQFVDGHELTRDRCILLDGGAEIELIAHSRSSWILISLAASLIRDAAPALTAGPPLPHPGVRLIKRSTDGFLALANAATNALSGIGIYLVASATRALAINVLQDAGRTIDASSWSGTRDDRARRRLAVERTRRYIWEYLAEPIRLSDLCAHAHLQARSLEYGFRELLGLAPMGYVRMLRLGEVRTQLLQGAGATRSISEIALDAGFSHLSQFVVDYKRVFGETPSSTRRSVLHSVRFGGRQRLSASLRSTPPRAPPSSHACWA